jgi:hypothetical protein
VNVAIPSLVRDFNSTLSTLQWTVTAFDDTFAVLAIMGLIAGLLGLALRRQTAAQRATAVLNNEEESTPERLLLAS